jgi:hypothetical protein
MMRKQLQLCGFNRFDLVYEEHNQSVKHRWNASLFRCAA